MKYAYYKGDLKLQTPLLFIKKGDKYVMKDDNEFAYPAKEVEEDDDWIKFNQ
jgi:hypothetical protein